MPLPSQAPKYFLGIGGEQTGPFSESDVIARIERGEIPPDAMVWYDGLPDWQPLSSIDYFSAAMGGPRGGAKANAGGFTPLEEEFPTAAVVNTPLNTAPDAADDDDDDSPFEPPARSKGKGKGKRLDGPSVSFADGEMSEPVFRGEGIMGASPRRRKLALGMLLLMAMVGAAGGGVFYLMQMIDGDSAAAPVAQFKPKFPPRGSASEGGGGAPVAGSRGESLRKALSELLLTPEASIQSLLQIVKESDADESGKEALNAIVDYYKQRQRYGEAGRLLMELKRPSEAIPYFLNYDPPSHQEADQALFAAYQATNDPSRRAWLVQDIEILLGPLQNQTLAVERIKLLETDFPKQPHPYGFYLKTVDQKITDLFQRLSFWFVQNLLGFISTEMPQINFVKRPLVQIRKEKGGKYRIVGSYNGEVLLSQDRLPKIKFTFWLFNEQWNVVETNLTIERDRFSRVEKKKRADQVLTSEKMLEYLQNVFRTLYPKAAFHEKIDLTAKSPSKSDFE